MYSVTKLSQASIRALVELQNQGVNHSRAFGVALGYVFSRKLDLPAMEAEDLVGYYRMNHALNTREGLSQINELMPFNMKAAEGDVLSFYQFRMNMVNVPEIPLAINPETSLIDFFTLSTCFSNEVLEVITKEGQKLTGLISRLTPIIKDLCDVSVMEYTPSGMEEKLPQ